MNSTPLTDDLARRGPCVIGATGGSGTRVTARIVRDAGMFIGADLNPYEDAIAFGAYSDRWIDRYLASPKDGGDSSSEMSGDLERVLSAHLADIPEGAPAWGWKEPRSVYLVPFLVQQMPSLRFLHFIRDGRDMAFSENQQQLSKHGRAVFPEGWPSWRRPVRSIALWNRVNLAAADFGERELGPRYLRVRFEDLCAEPARVVGGILDFFSLEGNAEEIGRSEVRPPDSLGRWREEGSRLISRLEREAGEGLRRFGYA